MNEQITLEQLNQLDLVNISDEQISETRTKLESVEDATALNEMIYFLLDGFYLLSEGSTQEENVIKTNENIKKILASDKLKEAMKVMDTSSEVA